MQQAWKRVRPTRALAGSTVLDRRNAKRLMWAWPAIREQLLRGRTGLNRASRHDPKPDGGQRELGIRR